MQRIVESTDDNDVNHSISEPVADAIVLREILDHIRELARKQSDNGGSTEPNSWGGAKGVPNFREGDTVSHEDYGECEVTLSYFPGGHAPYQIIEIEFPNHGTLCFHTQEIRDTLRYVPPRNNQGFDDVPF